MTALQTTGFTGPLSLEIFNDQFRAGSARSVAVDGYRSLLFLLDQLRARTGAAQAGLPALPARSRCLGTEFIEFAIDESGAVAFEAALRGLGFVFKKNVVTERCSCDSSCDIPRCGRQLIAVLAHTQFEHAHECEPGLQIDQVPGRLVGQKVGLNINGCLGTRRASNSSGIRRDRIWRVTSKSRRFIR